ncbi:hypothetical protein L6452_01414 [Arctium lappa]|uniref:Uncharacterized protein n=1 Tax=Arctium lappa TaxID=4217 RepID=A0ACB9FGT7_ARCLA|nr:hypothetical protein L6452_01414 [Arctium lappa]
MRGTAASQHKGLARMVLSDVIGLFNWRLWSLWSPNKANGGGSKPRPPKSSSKSSSSNPEELEIEIAEKMERKFGHASTRDHPTCRLPNDQIVLGGCHSNEDITVHNSHFLSLSLSKNGFLYLNNFRTAGETLATTPFSPSSSSFSSNSSFSFLL